MIFRLLLDNYLLFFESFTGVNISGVIKSAQLVANLISNVTLTLQAQFHYWFPRSGGTTTAGNVNLTLYCQSHKTATVYNATCKKKWWSPLTSINLTACRDR